VRKNNRGPLEQTKSSSNNNFIHKSGGRIEMKPKCAKKGKINKSAGIKKGKERAQHEQPEKGKNK
jgi:hypothetical protein